MCSVEGQILILDIHKYSTYVIETFGLILNFLVIHFVNTDNKGSSYKACVIIHCLMDIGLGIFHILGIFQVEAVGTTTFMTIAGPIQLIDNYEVHKWSFLITNFFFSCSIFSGSITIIYRYLVVVKKKVLETRSIIIMFILPVIIAGVIASQYIASFATLPQNEYEMYKKLLNNKIWARDKIYGNNFIALTSPINRKIGSFYSYFTIFSYLFTASIIILFSVLVGLHLRSNRSNMTKSTLKLEKQIQLSLIVQTLFPIILGYIPNILPTFFIMLNIPFQCYIIFVGVCITYIPLINPIILLFMTPQYRKRMLYRIGRRKKSVIPKTTTFIK
uniref:G-protein coupled receptors family 1 profile domain-containing protein n=1 Tax=Strongyloides stercoralis TaxID=6248 RepID=A0A0K0EQA6_STRER